MSHPLIKKYGLDVFLAVLVSGLCLTTAVGATVLMRQSFTNAPSRPAVDPYVVYLERGGLPELSREDVLTRAYLGCGQEFAPGTVDGIIADAYRPTGICGTR